MIHILHLWFIDVLRDGCRTLVGGAFGGGEATGKKAHAIMLLALAIAASCLPDCELTICNIPVPWTPVYTVDHRPT
jgi:hypothetical protein